MKRITKRDVWIQRAVAAFVAAMAVWLALAAMPGCATLEALDRAVARGLDGESADRGR